MTAYGSSNLAQSLGAALLAGGFYGPAEGDPPRRTEAGLLETRTHRGAVPAKPPRGLAGRIFDVLPIADDAARAVGIAIPIGRVAELAGITNTQAATNIPNLKGARRIGTRGAYRYYREPAQ